jgi:hypothetical protein
MLYGILRTSTNTGIDSEIQCSFVAPLSVKSNQPAYAQDSMNLRRHASSQNIQRWEIAANLHPENGTADFLTHSVVSGHDQPIYVRMPQVTNLVTSSGIITLTADVAAGTNVIHTSTTLVYGEFINIGVTNPKVYLVVSAVAGQATVRPLIVNSEVTGAAVTVGGKVTMTALYDSDTQLGITFTDGVLSDPGSVKLIERLV